MILHITRSSIRLTDSPTIGSPLLIALMFCRGPRCSVFLGVRDTGYVVSTRAEVTMDLLVTILTVSGVGIPGEKGPHLPQLTFRLV